MRFIEWKLTGHRFNKERKGVVAVEFALVFIPFFTLVLFTMELSRVIYLYAAIDLSLSEASQHASYAGNADGGNDYTNLFNAAFQQNIEKTPLLFKDDRADITVKYCDSIDKIITKNCSGSNSTGMPLAIYSISYHYKPVFFIFPSNFLQSSLTRNIIHVQEYERPV